MGAPDNTIATRLNQKFHYSRQKSFTDILDIHTYNMDGRFFHTVDGRFAKIWVLGTYSADTMGVEDRVAAANGLAQILHQFPEGSAGQFLRYCHDDIASILNQYLGDSNATGFGADIVKAVARRQIEGATSGFFSNVSQNEIDEAKRAAMEESGLTDEDLDSLIENVERSIQTGQYALQIENYLVFLYSPYWLKTGHMVADKGKKLLATLGLHDIKSDYRAVYEKEKRRFLEYALRIEQGASNFGFEPGSLSAQAVINLLYRELNPKRSKRVPPPEYVQAYTIREHLDIGRQSNVPDIAAQSTYSVLNTSRTGWEIDGVHHKIVSAKTLPKRIPSGLFYYLMQPVEGTYWVVMNFSVPKQTGVRIMLRLRRGATTDTSERKSNLLKGDELLEQDKKRDLDLAFSAVNPENQDKMLAIDATLHVVVKGEDEAKTMSVAQKVADSMWSGGFVEMNRADAMIHQCLPFNYRPKAQSMLQRELRMLSMNFADLAPTLTAFPGFGANASNSGMLVNNAVGMPVLIDIFATRAAHTLIQGGTGTGKSFLFNALLMQQQKYNPKVFIVDKGRSYQSLCEATGGSFVELVLDDNDGIKPTCINPFFIKPGKKPTLTDIEFMRDVLVAMVLTGTQNETVIKSDSSLLLKAVIKVFEMNTEHREIILSDIHSFLMSDPSVNENGEGRAVANRFVEFTKGNPYGNVFDGKLEVNWDADIIVFETERMATSKAMPVIMLSLFQQINVYCKWFLDPDRRKIVAVDEAWSTLSQPESAAAIAGFFREMRKYKCGVVLLSQTLSDFGALVSAATKGGSGESGGGILENTMHFFLLASSPGDHVTGQKILSLGKEDVACWQTVAGLPPFYSECYYRLRDNRDRYHAGKIRIYSNPLLLWTASSAPEDRAMRNNLVKEYTKTMSPEKARRQAVNDLAKKYPLGYDYYRKHRAA